MVIQNLKQEEFVVWRRQYRSEDLALLLYQEIEKNQMQERRHNDFVSSEQRRHQLLRNDLINYYRRRIRKLKEKFK